MFNFTFDDFPNTNFEIETSDLNLFAFVPPYEEKLALGITITARETSLTNRDGDFEVKPVFDTQWLEITLSDLGSKGADCLDGYQLEYDNQREEELGFDQFPGAIYAHSWAGFEKAEMTLRYLGAASYEIAAKGTTEFSWAFDLKAEVPLTKIDFANEDRQQDAAVEALMLQHFSGEAFQFGWQDAFGGPDQTWWHYRATPRS